MTATESSVTRPSAGSGLGVGGHPEGIVLGIQVLTLCRAHEVDELLGVFLLVSGTALDQGHGTHLIAGAVGGEGQLDGIALGGGLQTVVREGQGNGRLARATPLGAAEPDLVYWDMFLSSSFR